MISTGPDISDSCKMMADMKRQLTSRNILSASCSRFVGDKLACLMMRSIVSMFGKVGSGSLKADDLS